MMIETNRLILREYTQNDFSPLYEIMSEIINILAINASSPPLFYL